MTTGNFFWSKTILRYFYDSKTIYGPVGGHLRHRANLNLAADLRAAMQHTRTRTAIGRWLNHFCSASPMWSGWAWIESLPWAPSGTAPYLLKENTTIKDMTEALHSPGVLYGKRRQQYYIGWAPQPPLPPQCLPRAFQAKAVGGSLNSKINFLHSAVSNCHRKFFWEKKGNGGATTLEIAQDSEAQNKKKQQLFELNTHHWPQFRHG